MTEVICPFCGTPNPPEADFCSSCKKSLYTLPEGDQPDWLKNLRDFTTDDSSWQEQSSAGEPPPQSASSSEEEIPEWLARIRRRSLEDQHETEDLEEGFEEERTEPPITPPITEGEPPEWASFGEESEKTLSGTPEIPIEDWLGKARHVEAAPEDLEPAASEETAGLDWLDFGKSGSEEIAPPDEAETASPKEVSEPQSSETAPSEEIRGWLEQLLPEEQPEEMDLSAFSIPPAFQSESESPHEPEPDLEAAPEFLESMDKASFKTEFPDLSDDSTREIEGQGIGQHPAVDLPEPTVEAETGLSEDFGLGSVGSEDSFQSAQTEKPFEADESVKRPSPGTEAEIEPAQLPGWLEAIRPVESVAPMRFTAEVDNRVETSGPLAGFQGVIPGGTAASAYSRPAAYTVKLHVNDKQRIYANLLENLVIDEARPASRPAEKVAAPQTALTLFVAIILIGVLTFMMVSGFQLGMQLSLYAPETVAFFDAVQQLQPSEAATSRLLVAVDFEPGLAGEMQTIARYPLQQLLEGGTGLALISTVPTGLAMGEKLVADATALMPAFQYDQQVINLGYLVGGSTSLASLAANPSTAIQYSLDGQIAFNSPLLQGIQSMADFDGLLLITDNPETARAWVEQVQLSLGGKPLLVISSAQSAPMILPFYQSDQVQGILAGLSGSSAYDQLAQRLTGETRDFWDAYQSGMMLIILAILIGGIVHGIQAAIRSQQPAKRI